MNWRFWLELLVRSSVLLLAAEAARRWAGSRTASFRHKILLWALLLLAFVPVFSVVLPSLAMPIWRPARHSGTALVTTEELAAAPAQPLGGHSTDWGLRLWLTGVFATCVPVLAGAVSAARIARRARPFGTDCSVEGPEILISVEVSAPVTCGLWHPRILLPLEAQSWSSTRLQAVLAHELAHVRRRDVATQIGTHFVAALWWFQPLVWMLRRELRAESELACDADALQSGLRPSAYAAELVAVARTLGRGTPYALSSCGINMAHGSNLEQRIQFILSERANSSSRATTLVLAGILASAAVAASALTISSDSSFSEQGGSLMKRTLTSALLTSVGLSAATLTGTVHDPSGNAIAGATITVVNPDTGSKQDTATDPDGKFSLSGAAGGQYILKVEKPGFATILREFDLGGNSSMDRQLTMPLEGSQQSAEDLVTDSGNPGQAVAIGGKVAQSNLTKKVQPVYPMAAKVAGTQGTVQIKATISKDGVPVELQVVSTPSSELAESALEAVRQWRYRPTLLNGAPVEVTTTVIVNYTLAR